MPTGVLSHAPFLAEFLTTGRLGRIQLGMDLAEVVTAIGLPDGVGSLDEVRAWAADVTPEMPFLNIGYGMLELSFEAETAIRVRIYFDGRGGGSRRRALIRDGGT